MCPFLPLLPPHAGNKPLNSSQSRKRDVLCNKNSLRFAELNAGTLRAPPRLICPATTYPEGGAESEGGPPPPPPSEEEEEETVGGGTTTGLEA